MKKKITDKGWQAMQQLLDREMPVERKRRPLIWLWFLALLCSGSLALAWHLWPARLPVAVPANNSPVAEKQADVLRQPANEPDFAATPTQKQEQNRQVPAASEHLFSQKQNNVSSLKNLAEKKYPANEPGKQAAILDHNGLPPAALTKPEPATISIANSNTAAPPAIQAESNLDMPENPGQPAAQTEMNTAELATAPQQISPQQTVQSVPPAPANPAAAASVEPDPAAPKPTVINPVATRRTWALGATAGVFSTLNPGYSGANLGFTTEWQPLPKWGLRSGIAYQYHVLRKNERPILNMTTSAYVAATGDQEALVPSNITAADVLLTPVYIPVSRLHRFEAPLLAFWQPLNHWRVYGGIAVGTTVYAQAGARSLKDNFVLDIQSGAAAKNLNTEISNQVRNWDFRWSLGLGYKLNRRFAFDLFLHNPLRFAKITTEANPDQFNAPVKTVANSLSAQRPDGAGNLSLLQFSATWFF